MSKGSTPTKRRRHVDVAVIDGVERAVVDGFANRARCTKDPETGFHPTAGAGIPTPMCPACWPSSYAQRHARHRSDSFRYLTTEAHGVTR